jgi:polyhydroxyalkanoate synthesis repressor PhaR
VHWGAPPNPHDVGHGCPARGNPRPGGAGRLLECPQRFSKESLHAVLPPHFGPCLLRVLKKYPNRRLYDTRTSSYITLADVKQMVLAARTFEVRDAKTGEDLTRSILLQIILEEETGGVPMFSTQTLARSSASTATPCRA